MSSPPEQPQSFANGNKKAVHVKVRFATADDRGCLKNEKEVRIDEKGDIGIIHR
jgi:hypothetical protein